MVKHWWCFHCGQMYLMQLVLGCTRNILFCDSKVRSYVTNLGFQIETYRVVGLLQLQSTPAWVSSLNKKKNEPSGYVLVLSWCTVFLIARPLSWVAAYLQVRFHGCINSSISQPAGRGIPWPGCDVPWKLGSLDSGDLTDYIILFLALFCWGPSGGLPTSLRGRPPLQ